MNEIPVEVENLLVELNKKYPATVRRIRSIWGKDKVKSDDEFFNIMILESYDEEKPRLCFAGWRIVDRIQEIHRSIYGFVDRSLPLWHLTI